MSFGAFPQISLANARQMREESRALLSKGIDPQKQREQDEHDKKMEIAKLNL